MHSSIYCSLLQRTHHSFCFLLSAFSTNQKVRIFKKNRPISLVNTQTDVVATMPLLVADNLSRAEFVRSTSSKNLDVNLEYEGSPPSSPMLSPSSSTQVIQKVVIIKQQPKEEEVEDDEVLSAMPDPLNRKWHDSCYYLVSHIRFHFRNFS
jgi:hypothetical protein